MESNKNPDHLSAVLEIINFERMIALAFGIVVIVVSAKLILRLTGNLQERYPARRVIFLQIATVINFILYIFGSTVLIYAVLRPPKEVLLALAGSAAVAVGISLKDIVASVVAGIILLFDRPFQVGDRVTFGETYGEIIGIGLRTVKLVTLDDNLVTIPNARFLTDVVASGNAGALNMMVVIDFHIATDADIGLAKSIAHEVMATSRFAYPKKPITVLTSEVAVAEMLAIRIRAKAFVIDCRFEKAFETDVVTRCLAIFQKNQIKRPSRVNS